jgi:hypothetical protein
MVDFQNVLVEFIFEHVNGTSSSHMAKKNERKDTVHARHLESTTSSLSDVHVDM